MDDSWKDHFEPLIMDRMNTMDEESRLWYYIRNECDMDEARLGVSHKLFGELQFTDEQECLKMMDASDMVEMFKFAFERDEEYEMLVTYTSKSKSFILGVFNWVWHELGYDHVQSKWGAIVKRSETIYDDYE